MDTSELLSNVLVVDVTREYNSYAGKLLADMGAEVIKVEPPGGEPARSVGPHTTETATPNSSAFFGFLNTSKRSLALNPDRSDDIETLEQLCGNADVVIEDHLSAYGLSPATFQKSHQDTVMVSLNAFGRSGPRSEHEATELIEAATGGLMSQTGFPERPPTFPGLSAASYLGIIYGAIGGLLGLRARDEGAATPAVDISKQETIVALLESEHTEYTYNGRISTRNGNKHSLGHPIGAIYPTDDGHVCLCVFGAPTEGSLGGEEYSMWEPLCDLLGREDLLEDERFNALPDEATNGPAKRLENAEALDAILREELADWDSRDFYRDAQERGIAVSIVSSPADIFADPQLDAREFLTDLPLPNGDTVRLPVAPYQFSDTAISPTAAPKLDEYTPDLESTDATGSSDSQTHSGKNDWAEAGTEATGVDTPDDTSGESEPLDGIRVLDFTQVWAGPHGTKILADNGADVIKVEARQRPDVTRTMRPLYEDEQGEPIYGEDRSGYFQTENRNKRSLAIDLKTEEGIRIIKDLIESGEIDVVTESFAPGAMERLGLGHETLRDLDDDLIVCSLSGYGQYGPEHTYRAYGMMLAPHAGLASTTGWSEDKPVNIGVAFADPIAGIHMTVAILAALHNRRHGGSGQYIDVAMREAGIMLTHQNLSHHAIEGEPMARSGNRDERQRFLQGCYACEPDDDLEDDEEAYICLAIRDEADWQALKNVLDTPEWMREDRFATQNDRLANHDAFDARISEWTATKGRAEAVSELHREGIPAGVVQSTRDVVERDDHLSEGDFWQPIDHPVVGTHPYPGTLPRLSTSSLDIVARAPMFGSHSREILYELLSTTGEKVRELEEAGVLQ